MNGFDYKEHPHKRFNILTGEWVLVSPHRAKRPWQGKVETVAADDRPMYDSGCYLCPGNKRADGTVNPEFNGTNTFTNDFSALLKDVPQGQYNVGNLIKASSESGVCKVITFSHRHDITLPLLSAEEIQGLVEVWCSEFDTLSKDDAIKNIQIFENKGEIMGCSNPHPHGQIWAQHSLPQEIIKETTQQDIYYKQFKRSLLGDYLQDEISLTERIVSENKHFVALVPFWAVWPYETMIVSKRQVQQITQFTESEKEAFAEILKMITTKYDNLFETSFPYSAGMHQAPVNDGEHPEWHWHMHFYPPLLRSATVKKFMVGYEMLANPQRDISPEWAAEKLRSLPGVHYKLNDKAAEFVK